MWRYCTTRETKKGTNILLRGWHKGKRRTVEFPYYPKLYYAHQHGDAPYTSIYGDKLKEKEFQSTKDRKYWAKEYHDKVSIFNNLPPQQQFLMDQYGDIAIEDMVGNDLRMIFLDIETDGLINFQDFSDRDIPINLITIYDSTTGGFITWGLKPYDTESISNDVADVKPNQLTYHYCETEKQLLTRFLAWWQTDDLPDVVTGWNFFFDIGYIYDRCTKYWNHSTISKKLSPVNSIKWKRISEQGKPSIYDPYGKHRHGEQTLYQLQIDGVCLIDYLELYKTINQKQLESDKLDFVANKELKRGKVSSPYSDIVKFMNEDWNKFVNYNIEDVNLIKLLEDKVQFLQLSRMSAYMGFGQLEETLGKVKILTGAIANEARKVGQLIPYRERTSKEKFPGAFVVDPKKGISKDLVYMDINSLYPNTMITLNLSLETKVGSFPINEDTMEPVLTNGKLFFRKNIHINHGDCPEFFNSYDELMEWVRQNNYTVSKGGVVFSQKKRGIISKFLDDLYEKRKACRKEMFYCEDKVKKNQLNLKQKNIKLLLNSLYGIIATSASSLYDRELAMSVTITGRYATEAGQHGIDKITGGMAEIIAGDTDSRVVSITKLLKKANKTMFDADHNLDPSVESLIRIIEKHANSSANNWARESLNSNDPRYGFATECLCDVGLWTDKKMYVLSKIYGEDYVKLDEREWEYKGLKIVKAAYSQSVKTLLKNLFESIVLNADKSKGDELLAEAYDIFQNMSIDEIAISTGTNSFEKYNALFKAGGNFASKTPGQIKACISYNRLIESCGLSKKYTPIFGRQTVKTFYCNKNVYQVDRIAYEDVFPTELLDDIQPDYKLSFEKSVAKPIKEIYQLMNWTMPDVTEKYVVDINKMLEEGGTGDADSFDSFFEMYKK